MSLGNIEKYFTNNNYITLCAEVSEFVLPWKIVTSGDELSGHTKG